MPGRPFLRSATLAVLLMTVGCSGREWPADSGLFVVRVQEEEFRVRITTPAVVAEAMDRLDSADGEGIVSGRLAGGDGGFNAPWSWHLIPGTVQIADATIELCDGTPSMVEAHLEYWIDTVGRFCPWSGRLIQRLE